MMLDRMRLIFAALALLLGIAHIGYSIVVFKAFTLESYWFASAGAAMIVTALANFRRDKIWVLRVQNTLMFSFIIGLLILSPQPQVWFGTILFAGLFLLSCFVKNIVK